MGRGIADELAAMPGESVPPRPQTISGDGFRMRLFMLPELGLALWRMSNSAAVGHDGVSLMIVWRCFAELPPHILHIVNMSITSGATSMEKNAIVVPIRKFRHTMQPPSYNPVRELCVIKKLVKKSSVYSR